MRIVHALSVQLRQVCSLKLVACMAVFAGVQGLAISGLMVVTPDPSALYYYVLSTTSGTTYLTFYVLPTVPFSMSLAQEWDNHATPYWVIRSGGGVYTFSKLVGGASGRFSHGGRRKSAVPAGCRRRCRELWACNPRNRYHLPVLCLEQGHDLFWGLWAVRPPQRPLRSHHWNVRNLFHHPLSQSICGSGSASVFLLVAHPATHWISHCRKLHLLAIFLVFRRTYREHCLSGVWRKSAGHSYSVRRNVPAGNPCDEKEASSCVVSRWRSHPREFASAAG